MYLFNYFTVHDIALMSILWIILPINYIHWNNNLVDDSDIFTVDTDKKYVISHCPT